MKAPDPGAWAFVRTTAVSMLVLGVICAMMSMLQGLMGLLLIDDDVIDLIRTNPDLGTLPDWMIWIFQHLAALSFFAFVLSVVTAIAGLGLLRKQAWALRASIGMFWVGAVLNLAGIVGHGVFIHHFAEYWPGMPSTLARMIEANYWSSQISAAVFGLVFAVGFGWTAWKLGTPEVRQHFSSPASG